MAKVWMGAIDQISSTLTLFMGSTTEYVGGAEREVGGKYYILAKAGGTIAANLIVEISGYTAATGIPTVVICATNQAAGVTSNGAVASGEYFWLQVGGMAQLTTAAAVAAIGDALCQLTTAGKVDTYTGAQVYGPCAITTATAAAADETPWCRLIGMR